MMQSDVDNLLNDLLVRWHWHTDRYRFGKGYPSADATCKGHRASRQYDDDNGALDEAGEKRIMDGFSDAVERVREVAPLGPVWFTALQFQARNMATGHAVWTSPRLPKDAMERGIVLLEARNRLLRELSRDGVLS